MMFYKSAREHSHIGKTNKSNNIQYSYNINIIDHHYIVTL